MEKWLEEIFGNAGKNKEKNTRFPGKNDRAGKAGRGWLLYIVGELTAVLTQDIVELSGRPR